MRDKMSGALEATLRGIASPIRERTRPKPAEKKRGKNGDVLNLEFFRHKKETGAEPPFRKRKRTPDEHYIDSLKARMENEEDNKVRQDDDDISFVEDMAKKFKIKIIDKEAEKRRKIKELNEEATIPPQIEFDINGQ